MSRQRLASAANQLVFIQSNAKRRRKDHRPKGWDLSNIRSAGFNVLVASSRQFGSNRRAASSHILRR